MYILDESEFFINESGQPFTAFVEKDDVDLKSKYFKSDISNILLYNASKQILANTDTTNIRFGIIIGTEYGVLNTQLKYIDLLNQEINSSLLFKQSSNNLLSSLLAIANKLNCYSTTIFNGNTSGTDAIALACIMLRCSLDMALVGTVDGPTIFRENIHSHANVMLLSNENINLQKKKEYKDVYEYKTYSMLDVNSMFEILRDLDNYQNDVIFCTGVNKKIIWQSKILCSIKKQHTCFTSSNIDPYGVNMGLRCIKNISGNIRRFMVLEFEENTISMLGIKVHHL